MQWLKAHCYRDNKVK